MKIKVVYLGSIRETVLKHEEGMDVPVGISLNDFNRHIKNRYHDIEKYIFRVAVNKNIENEDIELHENDEIALLPAFAGG